MAVIAAFEFQDEAAAGEAARQAQRAHGGFGAGADQPHHFHARHQLDQQFGDLDFRFGGRDERQAVHGTVLDRAQHVGMGVAQQQRTPRTHIVDVFLVIGVPDARTFAARHEARRSADGTESAYRRIDPAGDAFLRAFEKDVVSGGHVKFALEWL